MSIPEGEPMLARRWSGFKTGWWFPLGEEMEKKSGAAACATLKCAEIRGSAVPVCG